MTRIGMAIEPGQFARIQRRRSRWRVVAEVTIALFAVVQLAAAGWLLSQRSAATVVAVDDLLAEVRAGGGDDGSGAGQPALPAPSSPAEPASSERSEQAVDADHDAPTQPGATAAADQDGEQGTSSDGPGAGETNSTTAPAPAPASGEPSAPEPAGFALPAEGVWTYDTTGGESLSLGGAQRDYPEQTFAIVEHTGGCNWTLDHRILEEHRTKATNCTEGRDVQAMRYQSWITWYGSTVESDYDCFGSVRARFRDQAGAVHHGECTDGSTTTVETLTSLGTEPITIDGVTIEALRYHMSSDIRGDVEGTSTQEFWIHPEHGLVLRLERSLESEANEFGARVTYTEDATFQLAALTPQR